MSSEFLKRFIDFFLTHSPTDVIDPYQELVPFGLCRVGRIAHIEGMLHPCVEIESAYLDRENIRMVVYAKKGRYKEGGLVQLIEARRGYDRGIESFKVTFSSLLTGNYETLAHEYLARPMGHERDLLNQDKLSRPDSLADLDT